MVREMTNYPDRFAGEGVRVGNGQQYGKGWRYRACVGVDPSTGKRRWATKGGFPTKKSARTALNAVLTDADNGRVVRRSKVDLGEYLDGWLDGVEMDVKPTTAAGYRRAVRTLTQRFGQVGFHDLTPLEVERMYRSLIKDGLASKTVRNTHGVLRRALAERSGWG